jgi:hypothetical protein
MIVFEAILLCLTSWTGFVIILGTVVSLFFRNKLIVKSTLPHITIPIDLLYLGMVALSAQQVLEKQTICGVYLWLPFLFTFALGNSYAIKCWRLYVLATTGRLKNMELELQEYYSPPIPESLEEKILVDVEIDSQEKDVVSRNSYKFWLDTWIYEHRWVGSFGFLWKVFLVVTAIELTVPLGLNLVLEEYQDPLSQCNNRTHQEQVLFASLFGIYIFIYLTTAIGIWNCKSYFGLRKQLLMSAISWIVVLIGFMVIKDAKSRDVFSIVCWLIPFSADTLWPSFRSVLQSKILNGDGQVLGIEEIIQWRDTNKGEPGWDALTAFMTEHMNSADSEENLFLLHGLFFIREYILKKNDMVHYWTQGILKNEDDQMDKELCAMVVLAWMKYLHKKGELIWGNQIDSNAVFLVQMKEIDQIRLELENALATIVRAKKYTYLTPGEQAQAGKKLREIYGHILATAGSEILTKFRKSVQFEQFMGLVQGKVSLS